MGSRGARPRPKKGIPRRSAGPTRQCPALPCLRAPGNKLEHRKDKRKSVPDYPAVSLTSICMARVIQGLPRPCPRGEAWRLATKERDKTRDICPGKRRFPLQPPPSEKPLPGFLAPNRWRLVPCPCGATAVLRSSVLGVCRNRSGLESSPVRIGILFLRWDG